VASFTFTPALLQRKEPLETTEEEYRSGRFGEENVVPMPGIDTPFLGCLAAIRAPDAVWHGRYLPKFRKNERKYSEDSERKFVGNAENFLPDFTARRT